MAEVEITYPGGFPELSELSDPDWVAPRYFTATIHGPDIGLRVALDIEMEGDNPRCRRLEVSPLDDRDLVTGEMLRHIPVARMLSMAVTIAAMKRTGDGEHTFRTATTPEEGHDFYQRFAAGARRPRQGSPLTADHLGRVAELYRAALERGDPPTQTIATEMHAARSTAARWVAQARKAGHLGPSLPGRAGEQNNPTTEAN